jgi:hypothetical protein
VHPAIRRFTIDGVSRAGLAALPGAERARGSQFAALSAPEPASGFAVVGVTWEGATPAGLTLSVRTLRSGAWSRWSAMAFDAEHGPTPGSAEAAQAVPGTDPFVVGDVDRVQVRAVSRTGRAPRGLTLSVVDPGSSPADRAAAVRTEPVEAAPQLMASASKTAPFEAPGPTPRPTIYSRADWGADERMRGCCTEYGEVHAGFVHHTVNANDYRRVEVPAILRGIYAYHTQSRGWRDIGYNFLIDKFGRIWEGRYGGVTRPVVGAHTLDYNENSFAASAIGNFQAARPTQAMLDAYARLYAWKLSLHGVRPTSRQNVAGTVFEAISGHRDAAATACPGIRLYKKIPGIIEDAANAQRSFAGRDAYRSFVDTAVPDLLTVDRGTGRVGIARGTGAPGFEPRQVTPTDAAAYDEVVAVGDVTGDGRNDVMARSIESGTTTVLKGNGDATFDTASTSSRKWANTDLFAGPGDLDEDGRADIVARDSATGALTFYAGRRTGGFAAGAVVVGRFGGATALSGGGDFTGDGHLDLLARDHAGRLAVLVGDGAGRFPSRVALPGAWSGKSLISAGADLTGDGRPDVVARGASGATRIFANIGGLRLSPGLGKLRGPMASMSLSSDLSGDARPDLVLTTATGALVVVPARRQNWLAPSRSGRSSWSGVDRVMGVGDWNGDGYADAMARGARKGRLWLYPGVATGGFGTRVGGWMGWSGKRLITPVGDFDGDGRPDLMATSKQGAVRLFPGRGEQGFKKPIPMRAGLRGAVAMAAVGRWTADGAPDVVVKTRTGRLLLYPGNGPGGLEDPASLGSRYKAYHALVGLGDMTGDGRADLVGRTADGDAWLLPGAARSADHPSGSFGPRLYLGSGWSAFRFG